MAATSAARGREVRQRLLRAAAALIAEEGWTGVSTRLVADRAGVTAGLVHYHFASLRSLLAEAAIGVMRQVVEELAPALDQAWSAADVLDLMLASLAGYTGSDPTSVLFIEAYLAATRDDELRRQVVTVLADFRRELARCLAGHGVAAPEDTAAALAAVVDGVLLHRGLDPTMTADRLAPTLRGILESTAGGRG